MGADRSACSFIKIVLCFRIERMWRELWNGCAALFYNLFVYMEETNVLDISNEAQRGCLHYVYIPRIQHHLDAFAECFSKRPLRTERNRTPQQLWVEGQVTDTVRTQDDFEVLYLPFN